MTELTKSIEETYNESSNDHSSAFNHSDYSAALLTFWHRSFIFKF